MRRRMMMGKRLPYDAEVEWIKSTAGAYVDTGIKASGNLRIKTTLYDFFTQEFLGKWCFGGRNGNLDKSFGIFISKSRQSVFFTYSNTNKEIQNFSAYPQTAVVEIGNGIIQIGGIGSSYNIATFISDYNLLLFGYNDGGNVITYEGITMGDTYITDGVTTLDLIPVRKNGKGYMYDRISGELRGTGDFIAGPDK